MEMALMRWSIWPARIFRSRRLMPSESTLSMARPAAFRVSGSSRSQRSQKLSKPTCPTALLMTRRTDSLGIPIIPAQQLAPELAIVPPHAAGHLVHADLELAILEPVGAAQQCVEHGRIGDVREDGAEVRAKCPV